MYDKICLFGAGGHGRVVASQIKMRWPQSSLCFADEQMACGTDVAGVSVSFNTPDKAVGWSIIVTIGDNKIRASRQQQAEEAAISMATFIADEDRYFTAPPGKGSMVLSGAIVTSDASIGKGVIVNNGAIIEHDSVIGDFCHLAPGSILAGGSVLGAHVFVGAGAQIVNQAQVADGTIIGAGSCVIKNIDEPGIYVGSPARRIGPV